MNLRTELEVIRITGFWPWLLITLRWDEVRAWFEQIWFCHHNARVLADMEYRLGCVLNLTTRGMSQAYYKLEDMRAEIALYHSDIYDDGYADGCDETKAELAAEGEAA